MAVEVGSAVGYLDLDISGFLSGLKSAQNEADKSTQNMATKIGTNISGAGKSISSVGTTLTKNVTLPLAGIGIAGLKVATDFEKGMSEVRAISGATGSDFDALREKAIELGADTAFSSGEVASAMTEMAKAGWDSQQIIDGMGGVLAAAAASGEGLATVSTIVADSITGFGLAASDSTKVADLLTQAANSGTIGITDLGESFKYVAPVAGAMGLSIEDTTTAISAMSMAGIKGSQAGTSLRTMLTNLVNPSDNAAAVMKELGISATNADGSMKSLDEIVANLRDGFSGLTEAEKAQNAAILAGKTGMSGMLALLNLTEEEYNAIAESMDNAGGVAEQTAAIMQDNLQSKLEQLGGALESLAIKMADLVIPYIRKLVEWVTTLVDKFTNLDPATQKTILVIAGIAAAIGPVLTIIGKLTTGVGNMITTFGKIPGAVTKIKGGFNTLSTGLMNMKEGFTLAKSGFGGLATQAGGFGTKMGVAAAGITGPMLAIVAVIAVVVAAFASLWKNNEEFRNKVTEIWNGIKETFNNFTQGIVDRLNSLGFNFSSITDVIKTIWEGFCNFLAPIFEGVFQQIANVFKFITDTILNTLDFWIAIFKGDWSGAWDAIKAQFENVWNLIKGTFQNILNVMKGIFNTVLGWFGTSWDECWTGIKTFFENIWNGIVSFFEGVWNTIKAIWEPVAPFFTMIWENIKSVYSVVQTFFEGMFRTAWESIKAVWDAVTGYFSAIWDTIKGIFSVVKSVLSGNWSDAWAGIKAIVDTWTGYFSGIWENIKGVFSTVVEWFSSTFSSAWTAVQNVFANWGSFFSGLWDRIKTTFATLGTSIANAISGAVKSGINGVISLIESTIRSAVNIINGAIGLINLIPGVSVGKITAPTLPRLATGAVLPPNNPFLAIVGDQKRGVNIEAPLSTIQEAVALIIKSFAYKIIELQKVAISILAQGQEDLGYIAYNGFKGPKKNPNGGNPETPESGNGDTFIFNSPKPIDEIEAAKQMKKAKRDLAEGF